MNKKDFIIENGLLTAYIGKSEYIEVPDEVTAIAEFAFEGNDHIKSIVMPSSVLEIGRATFARCKNLTSVVLSNALTVIETHLFNGCEKLTDVSLPKNLKEIKRLAFYQCERLSDMNLPNTVTIIGANAFSRCTSLESITGSSSLIRIGDRAFSHCESLRTIHLFGTHIDLGAEIFFEAASKIRVIYHGSSSDFLEMITAKTRAPRPWETMGNIKLHTPVFKSEKQFAYQTSNIFKIEVFCKEDQAYFIFTNNQHLLESDPKMTKPCINGF